MFQNTGFIYKVTYENLMLAEFMSRVWIFWLKIPVFLVYYGKLIEILKIFEIFETYIILMLYQSFYSKFENFFASFCELIKPMIED